jgi:hypothetical protein
LPQFNIKVWIVIWFYLNLLAPIIGLIIRRILPLPIIFVTDQDNNTNLLKWWGYKITEQVPKNNFTNWLSQHSDSAGCIPNHYLILLDMTNPIADKTIANWVEIILSVLSLATFSQGVLIKRSPSEGSTLPLG